MKALPIAALTLVLGLGGTAALLHAQATPPGGVEADVVALGALADSAFARVDVRGKIVRANRRQCAPVPADRCSESRDDRRSPLHRDLIASLQEQLGGCAPLACAELNALGEW